MFFFPVQTSNFFTMMDIYNHLCASSKLIILNQSPTFLCIPGGNTFGFPEAIICFLECLVTMQVSRGFKLKESL